MDLFPENQIIEFIDGTSCVVKEQLGVSGSRAYYRVGYGSSDYRLVWDSSCQGGPESYDYMHQLYNSGAPSDSFEWPLAITQVTEGQYGYITSWVPEGFLALGSFQVSRVRFHSPHLMLTTCSNMIKCFQDLHDRGLCYHNIDEQVVCVNPENGQVFMRHPEYIAPSGASHSFSRAPFITPLELLSGNGANAGSDCFSLAYMLFVVIYGITPFSGRLRYEYVIPSMAPKAYVFIFDPDDERNRVPFNFDVLKKKWATSPDVLRDAFVRAFGSKAINTPDERIGVAEWRHIFKQAEAQCVRCPHCGRDTFIDISAGGGRCMCCGKDIASFPVLKVNEYKLPLMPGQDMSAGYLGIDADESMIYASVVSHPQHPDRWGVLNKSQDEWEVTLPDGQVKCLPSGKIMPILPGMAVRFKEDTVGEIVN